jgi:hypothetical protein
LAKWPLAWGMEHGAWGMEHRVRDQGSGDGKTKLIAGSSQLKEKGEDRGQRADGSVLDKDEILYSAL